MKRDIHYSPGYEVIAPPKASLSIAFLVCAFFYTIGMFVGAVVWESWITKPLRQELKRRPVPVVLDGREWREPGPEAMHPAKPLSFTF